MDEVRKAIDAIEEYSYQHNIKIVRVPELNSQEMAMDTSKLCANLFFQMGTDVAFQDIGIAHRVPLRNASNFPKPIICTFTRRLAKESATAHQKDACKSIPVNLGLLRELLYPQLESLTISHPQWKLSSPKRRNLNLITTLNSVGPRIPVFIFIRTRIPTC